MPRISGVDIPDNKPIRIALRYIYGIGPTRAESVIQSSGVAPETRVRDLTEHLKVHSHDHASRRGLKKLVGQRRRLLRYLESQDIERYRSLIQTLGLRR